MEDEYYSEDSDFDSDSSFDKPANNLEGNNFGHLYEHKQLETLKFLRITLKENKILKRRINYAENELERYLDFKAVLPVTEEKRSDSVESDEPINEELLVTTDDVGVQTDFLLIPDERVKSQSPVVIKVILLQLLLVLFEKSQLPLYNY